MMRYFISVLILMLVLMFCLENANAQRSISFAADAFGYQNSTSCDLIAIDISSGGQALVFTDTNGMSVSDDGVAVVMLPSPIEFYQQQYNRLLVSSNGYVTLANNDNADNGMDFSNDCPLPAVPGNGALELARIAVLHDDLEGVSAQAEVYQQFITPCPRPGSLADEGCQVVQWQDWSYRDQSGQDDVTFQLLLYPASRQVVLQYPSANYSTVSATIGLQSGGAFSAFNQGCNQLQTIPASGAICLDHPLEAEVLSRYGFESLNVR